MFSNRFLKFATAVVAFVVSSACSAALGQPDSGTTIAPSGGWKSAIAHQKPHARGSGAK